MGTDLFSTSPKSLTTIDVSSSRHSDTKRDGGGKARSRDLLAMIKKKRFNTFFKWSGFLHYLDTVALSPLYSHKNIFKY